MNRHLSKLPPCPVCGSTASVRRPEWQGAPEFTCDDCGRAGRGAGAYFDAPTCPDCNGSRIRHDGYVADDGETYRECATCR